MSTDIQDDDEFEHVAQGEFNKFVRTKITHVLTIYPKLSMSMIQVGIGTSLSPKLWRAVLDQMAAEGLVKISVHTVMSPSGRAQVHNLVSLVPQAVPEN